MERSHPDPAGGLRRQQLPDPFAHFSGRLVGKGQRKDRIGGYALFEHIGDAAGQHAGFAGTGPGHDQRRTPEVDDGLALRIVQFLDIFRHNDRHY